MAMPEFEIDSILVLSVQLLYKTHHTHMAMGGGVHRIRTPNTILSLTKIVSSFIHPNRLHIKISSSIET